jgi:hypothetical protein
MRFREAVYYVPDDDIVALVLMFEPDTELAALNPADAFLDLGPIRFANVPETTVSPAITGFSPRRGRRGTLVTIAGSGFAVPADRNMVYFDGMEAPVLSGDATTLIAKSVGHGARRITVRSPGGGMAQSDEPFTFLYPPAVFEVVSGNNQVAPTGSTLEPLKVGITDGENGLPNVAVRFSVLHGPAELQASEVTTGEDGVAGAVLVLGGQPGIVRVKAETDGFEPRFFEAEATPLP